MIDLHELIADRLKETEPELYKQFSAVATSSGWDEEAAQGINFSSTGMKPKESHKTAIEDLEYGNGSSPAKPALRRFKPDYNAHLEKVVEQVISDYLRGKIKK